MVYQRVLALRRFVNQHRAAFLMLAGLTLLLPAPAAAQSLEDLQLKRAEEEAKAKEKGAIKVDLGIQGVLETTEAVNRDRPSSATSLTVIPELRLNGIYAFQIIANGLVNHLSRDANPWDLPDWSLQFSDRRIYKEENTGITFSGSLRYSFPTSIASRVADTYGSLRAAGRASWGAGPFSLGFEFAGARYFAKYTTSDTSRWLEEDNIGNNTAWSLTQRYSATWMATSQLAFTLYWIMQQAADYEGEAAPMYGSLADTPRDTSVWEHYYTGYLDGTYAFNDNWNLSAGYFLSAPQLQNGGAIVSLNPFNPKYGQLYVDLVFMY